MLLARFSSIVSQVSTAPKTCTASLVDKLDGLFVQEVSESSKDIRYWLNNALSCNECQPFYSFSQSYKPHSHMILAASRPGKIFSRIIFSNSTFLTVVYMGYYVASRFDHCL